MNSEQNEALKMLNASLNIDYDQDENTGERKYTEPQADLTSNQVDHISQQFQPSLETIPETAIGDNAETSNAILQQTQYPAPPEQIIYANVEYPVLPEDQSQPRPHDQEISIDPDNADRQPAAEVPFLLKNHPLFIRSNLMTCSHFAIMLTFIYNLYTFSKTSNHESLMPAVYLEVGLAFIHYLLRLAFRKNLQRTEAAFMHQEIFPEIIRILSCGFLLTLQFGGNNSSVVYIHEHIMSIKTMTYFFLGSYITGCLARFNFMHSLFSPSMSNLASSILVGLWVKFTYTPDARHFTGYEDYPTLYWIAMIFGYFTLFIAAVKCLSTIVHAVYAIAACKVTVADWKFFIMSNLWGVDYLLFSGFVIATCSLMMDKWESPVGVSRNVLKYSGFGYIGFYPLYTLFNVFLPYFMTQEDLHALRTFETLEVEDQVRVNIQEARRGNTVRVVTNKNSAEKMITLFQVSPFFFSEKANQAAGKQKYQFKSDAEAMECLICFSNTPECLITPCMHGGVCTKCSKDILQRSKNCPFCRTRINSIKVIEDRGDSKYLVKETIYVR